ncbi:MAG: hypothetical protein J6T73_01270, partial [Clostridia bacterium]|nr:hypothetical protein [Clostridia bacterium]
MKKVLSVLLAVILVATLSFNAVMLVSATSPQIIVSSTEAAPGETVDVTIALKNNPGVSSMKLKVAFPADLTLNKPITYNITEAGGQATQPGKVTSPATLNWVSPFEDVVGDYTFATLSFTVADTATAGDKAITVTYNQDDVYNLDEDDVVFAVTDGKITVTAPSCAHTNKTEYQAVASTCTTAGHGAYTKCNDCGTVISGSDAALPLDPNNHEGEGTEVRGAATATCTAAGYTGDT